jgi:hypothetical protein
MTGRRRDLRITPRVVDDACVLIVDGVLNASTYLPLRDAIIKAALDEPTAVVVDITGLVIRDDAALAVFTSARWQVSEWPDTPIGLVCAHPSRLNIVRRKGITRYVPIYPSLGSAISDLAADAARRYRRRVRSVLPALTSSIARSQELTAQWLTAWSRTDFTATVSVAATVLAEMAIAGTDDPFALRLETDGSTMTVAVQYSPSAKIVRQESDDDRVSGLDLIAASCRVWGRHTGAAGNTVWVVLGPENRS